MLSKFLLIVLFFAVQCIDSFEAYMKIIECDDDESCLENVYDHNLHEGFIPIIVAEEILSINIEKEKVIQDILNFLKRQREDITVLRVNVCHSHNKVISGYLHPTKLGEHIHYPFVTALKNDRVLNALVYDYNEKGLQTLLNLPKDVYYKNYGNFSIDIFKMIETDPMYEMRPIREDVRNALSNRTPTVQPLFIAPKKGRSGWYTLPVDSSASPVPVSVAYKPDKSKRSKSRSKGAASKRRKIILREDKGITL